jgi:hypothetical protein
MSERIGYTALALIVLAIALIFCGLMVYSIGFDTGIIISKVGVLLGCTLITVAALFAVVVCMLSAWQEKD